MPVLCPDAHWSGFQMASEHRMFNFQVFKWDLNTGLVFEQKMAVLAIITLHIKLSVSQNVCILGVKIFFFDIKHKYQRNARPN